MTNYERIKAMSIEEMAAFVEAAGRNNCQKYVFTDKAVKTVKNYHVKLV